MTDTQQNTLFDPATEHDHDGINSKQVDYNNLKNKPSGEWTYLDKVTFSNSSTTQSFTGLALYDLYKIRFLNITKSSTLGALNLGIQVNNDNGALNYGVSLVNFGGTFSSGSGDKWQVYAAGAAGKTFYQGEYVISGVAFNATNYKGIWGSGTGAENGGTDTYLVRGTTTNNADVTSIQIVTSDAITGTVELWGRNAS